MADPKTVEVAVVGLRHHLSRSSRHLVSKELPMKVALVREQANEHDENAIMVVLMQKPWKNLHLGYLPRAVAAVYAPRLDSHKIVFRRAKLVQMDDDAGVVAADLVKRKSPQRTGI